MKTYGIQGLVQRWTSIFGEIYQYVVSHGEPNEGKVEDESNYRMLLHK